MINEHYHELLALRIHIDVRRIILLETWKEMVG
jgi:hypothetical protein